MVYVLVIFKSLTMDAEYVEMTYRPDSRGHLHDLGDVMIQAR